MPTVRKCCPVLCLLVAAVLCEAPFLSAQQKSPASPHLLLVSVDTLRADGLHCYGYPHRITPNIDRLASRGVLFEDTITTIGKTGPAFASLFSSLYPPTHGARRNGVPMRADVPVLAELLKNQGYSTAAFISNWTLRARLAATHRGFDLYDETFDGKRNSFGAAERSAPAVTSAALAWLESHSSGDPIFLWVHYSEPHTPFVEQTEFAPPRPDNNESGGRMKRWRYASEIAYTDHWIGRLLEEVEPYLPAADTIVVFVGDHGESLGEHGYWGHGKNTHWPNLRIPLILAGPGVPSGRRIAGPASILDVLPTLSDILAFAPPKNAEGISLIGSWDRPIATGRARFALGDRHTATNKKAKQTYSTPLQIAFLSGHTKTIFDFQERATLYFDLRADPTENKALPECPVESVPPCRRRLSDWYRGLAKYEARSGELSPEDLKQLESLGYIGG